MKVNFRYIVLFFDNGFPGDVGEEKRKKKKLTWFYHVYLHVQSAKCLEDQF